MQKHKYGLIDKLLFLPSGLDRSRLKAAMTGKTVLITGASSGIGEQVAYLLADIDMHLILVARREDKLSEVKAQIERQSARVSIFKADLRNEDEADALLEFVHGLPGGLDVVVSNAGKSIRRPLGESLDRMHDFTRTMAINYFAPVRLLLSVIPILAERHGLIINVSTAGVLLKPAPKWAAYQASKTAFDVWLRSSEPELRTMGVSVASLYFPLVRTPMMEPTEGYRTAPAMSAAHAAEIVCKAMYSKRKKYSPWWLKLARPFAGRLDKNTRGN